jgi:DNA-binding MarR family transcriptional regulator
MATATATGRLLKRAQYRNHRAVDRALGEVGTTLAQWDALRAIHEAPDSSAHDLATRTFQSDQAFGTLANRLERQGLIERTSGHGRRVEHRLTSSGRAMYDAGVPVAAAIVAQSLSQLSPDEITVLHDLLERVGIAE